MNWATADQYPSWTHVSSIKSYMWTRLETTTIQESILWPPWGNSRYLTRSIPVLYSLPPDVVVSPRFAKASNKLRICSFGTISSLRPLNIRIGVSGGILGTLDIESHFWWHRNAKGLKSGRAWGMRLGREVKVFSRMTPVIFDIKCESLSGCFRMWTYLVGIFADQVNRHSTPNRLAIQDLQDHRQFTASIHEFKRNVQWATVWKPCGSKDSLGPPERPAEGLGEPR